jgi:hypothetical protein
MRKSAICSRPLWVAALMIGGAATAALAIWPVACLPSHAIPLEHGEIWTTLIWAALAVALLAAADLSHRRTYQFHATVMAVLAALHGVVIDLFASAFDSTGVNAFRPGPLLRLGITAAILFAGLPFAFRLRRATTPTGTMLDPPASLAAILRRPEQWFFFAPFSLLVIAFAARLSSGHITIGWALLGVGAFLFALAVGERSFRLAGLALLMLSVLKIALMDVWSLSWPDRFATLIVLGLALLGVSFLYTRFGTVFKKYL